MTVQNLAEAYADALRLDGAGQMEAARSAYLALLAEAPDHGGALNHLGALLCRTGFRTAARTAFSRAAICCPDEPGAFVNLANLLREDGETEAAESHYRAALASAPGCVEAHQGLAYVLAETGRQAEAASHRCLGWQGQPFSAWPYRGDGAAVRVLVPFSVLGGNVPVRQIFEHPDFAVTSLAIEFYEPGMALPPHDVLLNAVGDADLCGAALAAVAALPSAAPVLNGAALASATGRASNARRLGQGPGLRTPRLAHLPRAAITEAGLRRRGFRFPLLLRAPGFHAGQHFLLVDSPATLPGALASLPGEDIIAAEMLDARGADGMVRKYRVMVIGGQLYPLHLALSRGWKVHYFSAAMASSAAFRAEEEAFLTDMAAAIGPRACAALAWVADRLALDYAGMDFALAPDGTVLLFEANATMALVQPAPGPQWDYRRPAFQRALDAARGVVLTAAAPRSHPEPGRWEAAHGPAEMLEPQISG